MRREGCEGRQDISHTALNRQPPFLGALRQFAELCADYKGRVDFMVVYLEEAHPTDGWMYGAVRHKIAQHTRIEERRAAARVLESELETIFSKEGCGNYGEAHSPPPVAVDQMDNQCSLAFGALVSVGCLKLTFYCT